jgi:hypothetical protein
METDKLVRYFGSTLNAPVARMIMMMMMMMQMQMQMQMHDMFYFIES